jgi:hypothetical protein
MEHMQEAVSKTFLTEKRNDAELRGSVLVDLFQKRSLLLSVLELKNNLKFKNLKINFKQL